MACVSKEDDMITLDPTTQLTSPFADRAGPDEAELAAISFLARYSGRTLDAYRHDLRILTPRSFACFTKSSRDSRAF
jgi:hypothetical protein